MKNKSAIKTASLAIFMASLFLSSSVQATLFVYAPALGYACKGCDESQRDHLAQTILQGGLDNIFYIYDWNAGTIYQYQIIRDSGATPYLTGSHAIYLGEAPSDIKNAYDQIRVAVARNGDSSVFTIQEDTTETLFPERDRSLNGYDVAITSQARNDIIDWLNHKYGTDSTRSGVVGYLLKTRFERNILSAKFIVHLVDGSKVIFVLEDGDITMTQAIDANSNVIPQKAAEAPGRYNFGSRTGATNFLKYMHTWFGYDIPSSIPESPSYVIACASGSDVTTCTIVTTGTL